MSDPSPTHIDESVRRVSADEVARIKAAEVFDKTRKSWTEWFIILDEFDVAAHGRAAAIHFLRNEYEVEDWWAEAIVTRYADVLGLGI